MALFKHYKGFKAAAFLGAHKPYFTFLHGGMFVNCPFNRFGVNIYPRYLHGTVKPL